MKCASGFHNNSIYSPESTNLLLNMDFSKSDYPEVFANPAAEWRIVDMSGWVVNWIVILLPSGTAIANTTNGTAFFSLDNAQNGEGLRVALTPIFPLEANGTPPVDTITISGHLGFPPGQDCATPLQVAVAAIVSLLCAQSKLAGTLPLSSV